MVTNKTAPAVLMSKHHTSVIEFPSVRSAADGKWSLNGVPMSPCPEPYTTREEDTPEIKALIQQINKTLNYMYSDKKTKVEVSKNGLLFTIGKTHFCVILWTDICNILRHDDTQKAWLSTIGNYKMIAVKRTGVDFVHNVKFCDKGEQPDDQPGFYVTFTVPQLSLEALCSYFKAK